MSLGRNEFIQSLLRVPFLDDFAIDFMANGRDLTLSVENKQR